MKGAGSSNARAAGRRRAAGGAARILRAAGGSTRERPTGEGPLPPADATYTARGVVYQLPAQPGGDVMIHHEAIPEFVDRKGERSGMDSMTMPFTLAPEAGATDLQEGDKVEITFELRWKDGNLRIVRLTELPAGTELNLGGGAVTDDPPAASPAAETGAEAGAAASADATPASSPAASPATGAPGQP